MCGLEFPALVMQRYATKRFDGRPLPEDKVRQLLELVRYAPSGLNLQPWKIKVVTDPAVKAQLLPATWNQAQVTSCSHLLVFCAVTTFKGQIEKVAVEMQKHGVDEATVTGFTTFAKEFAVKVKPEQLKSWAQANVFLALAYALLGAKALGFDSCPMGGFDPEAYAKILKLPPTIIPTMLCALGYAADAPSPKIRLPLEEIIF